MSNHPRTTDSILKTSIRRSLLIDIGCALTVYGSSRIEENYIPLVLFVLLLWLLRELRVVIVPDKEKLVGAAVVLIFILDATFSEKGIFFAMVHALNLMTIAVLFRKPTMKELHLALMLGFFNISITASATQGLWFAPLFLAYLLVTLMGLINTRAVDATVSFPKRGKATSFLFLAGGMLVLIALVFVFTPRLTTQSFIEGVVPAPGMVGFTTRLDLGDISSLLSSSQVIMRVKADRPQYWRGGGLDYFTGHGWRDYTEKYEHYRRGNLIYLRGDVDLTQDFFVQEYTLFTEGGKDLFAAYQPMLLSGMPRIKSVLVSQTKGITVSEDIKAGTEYTVYSAPYESRRQILIKASDQDPEYIRRIYLQLPKDYPKIRQFALDITRPFDNRYDKAAAIRMWFLENYEHSLEVPELVGKDVEYFILEGKRGYCSWFASAMCLMLRTIDIPCRIGVGFREGMFNNLGRYYLVRQKDAHAWVEVYFPGYGWNIQDPTPGGLMEMNFQDRYAMFLDKAHFIWRRFIIDYRASTQRRIFEAVAHGAKVAFEHIKSLPGSILGLARKNPPMAAIAFVLLMLAIIAGLLYRAGLLAIAIQRMQLMLVSKRRLTPVQRLYLRALKLLAARGYNKHPWETARELAKRIQAENKELGRAVWGITDAYEEARFGYNDDIESLKKQIDNVRRMR